MKGMIPTSHEMQSDPVLMGWNVSAAVSILLPLMIMTISRLTSEGEDDGGDEDGNGRRWWQWGNNNNNENNNNNNDRDENVPWWWFWGEAERDPEYEGRGALVFAYLWSLLIFVGLVLYGNFVFRRGTEFEGLQGALVMFTNLALIVLVLVAGLGAINMEGREIEETGWYGQFAVCVFLTCLFWFLQGIVFTVLLRRRNMATAAAKSSSFAGWYNMMASSVTPSNSSYNNDPTTTETAAKPASSKEPTSLLPWEMGSGDV